MRTAATGHYSRLGLVLKLALVAAWATLIFVLSSLTSSEIQDTSSLFARLPFVHILLHPIFVHMALYALLGVLAYSLVASLLPATKPSTLHVWLVTLAFCVAYGAGDELHQSFVPGRDMSLLDLGVNAMGALAGMGAAEATARWGRLGRARPRRN